MKNSAITYGSKMLKAMGNEKRLSILFLLLDN